MDQGDTEEIGGGTGDGCSGCRAREREIEQMTTILRAIGALSGQYAPH